MIIKILSLIIIFLGIGMIFLAIYDTPKRAMKMNIKDKTVLDKYIKSQRLLDLILGIFYFIMGVLLVTEIITGEYIVLITILISFLHKKMESRIYKNIKQ